MRWRPFLHSPSKIVLILDSRNNTLFVKTLFEGNKQWLLTRIIFNHNLDIFQKILRCIELHSEKERRIWTICKIHWQYRFIFFLESQLSNIADIEVVFGNTTGFILMETNNSICKEHQTPRKLHVNKEYKKDFILSTFLCC